MRTVSQALRALIATVAGLVMVAVLAAPAFAATYRVRVFGGNEGVVDGQTSGGYAYKDVNAGERIELSNEFPVTINDPDTYYQRGYRESGKDNLTGSADSVLVTEDMDFVVSYGVKGDMTTYTIRFVDNATGQPVTDDQGRTSVTYEGKVGDKPVVAYSYVPGYRPRYNNITGTLKEGENVWDLPYIKIETTTTTTDEGTTTTNNGTTTTTTYISGGGGTTGGGTTTTTTVGGGGGTTTTTNEGGNDNETTSTVTTNEGNQNNDNQPATEEILDVDNPLASGNGNKDDGKDGGDEVIDDGKTNTPTPTPEPEPEKRGINPAMAVLGAIVAAVIGGLLFFFFRSRRDDALDLDLGDDEDEEDEDEA